MRGFSLIAGVALVAAVFAAPQVTDTSADVSILQNSGVPQDCKACEGAVDAARKQSPWKAQIVCEVDNRCQHCDVCHRGGSLQSAGVPQDCNACEGAVEDARKQSPWKAQIVCEVDNRCQHCDVCHRGGHRGGSLQSPDESENSPEDSLVSARGLPQETVQDVEEVAVEAAVEAGGPLSAHRRCNACFMAIVTCLENKEGDLNQCRKKACDAKRDLCAGCVGGFC